MSHTFTFQKIQTTSRDQIYQEIRFGIRHIFLYEEGRYFLIWSSTLVLLLAHNVLDQIRTYLPSS
jgi:hypothetical protein